MSEPAPNPGGHERDPLLGAGGLLTIDLAAIGANWRLLADRVAPAACGAVVKADAYGLGIAPVGPALFAAGCRRFFVAHVEEGIALRTALPSAEIAVLHGAMPGAERDCLAYNLVPVLNSPGQVAAWSDLARGRSRTLPAILQVDSGMARMGLSEGDVVGIAGDPARLAGIACAGVMSHLACADEPAHPANAAQREAFERLRRSLPAGPASLAASSGIFLGADYRFDLVRPGAALFGVNPLREGTNPMQPVLRLQGRVVQTGAVPAGTPVGYGWTARTARPSRLATIAVGYGDGFLRSLSNTGAAWLGGTRLAILGRVSMDSIVVDATDLPEGALMPGQLVDLLGPRQGVDDLAAAAGTIGYEILTSLGRRYHRRYVGA